MRMMAKWVVAGSLLVAAAAFAGPEDERASPADELLDGYLAAQTALAGDDTTGVTDAAKRMEQAADALVGTDEALAASVKTQAQALGAAKDLAAARAAFKPLSSSVVDFVQKHYEGSRSLGIYRCTMAGGRWVQEGAETRNPYYGSEMLTCGERVGSAGRAAPAGT